MLVMWLGLRRMYIILGCFVLLGQMIFAIGDSISSMNTIILGRIIFGFGKESLNITQNAMMIKWFIKREIALPFGLKVSASRIGSALNGILTPRIATINDSSKALWVGFFICVFSFISSVICCIIDWNEDNKDSSLKKQEETTLTTQEESPSPIESIKLLPKIFWVITILCALLYGILLPFNHIASGLYVDIWLKHLRKQEAIEKAGMAMGFPYLVSIILVPIFSGFIDKYGCRDYILFISSLFSLLAFSMFYFFTPIYSIILLGLSYSLFASVIWPTISLVVANNGFAYGVTASIQNLVLAVFPIIVAFIFSKVGENYYDTLYFFVILSCLAIINSALLIYMYKINNNVINKKLFAEDSKNTERRDQEKTNDFIYGAVNISSNSELKK